MTHFNFITLFISLIGTTAIGQNYYSFPTENAKWNVYLEYSISEAPTDTVLMRYTLCGDTIVNEKTYSKLCLETGDTLQPTIRSVGGIREEDRKIFYLGEDFLDGYTEGEVLLYDFSKQIGDTVFHYPQYEYPFSIIMDTDSILIDETYRKRFKIDSFPEDYWVEGIGSIKNGLLGHITSIPTCCYHYWEHVCFKENSKVKYLNPNYDACYPENLLSKANLIDNNSNNITLYPNPLKDKLYIQGLLINSNIQIEIFNSNGQIVISKQINHKTNLEIEIPFHHGLYFIRISDRNGKCLLISKIVK